jgi:hypothetical protein
MPPLAALSILSRRHFPPEVHFGGRFVLIPLHLRREMSSTGLSD